MANRVDIKDIDCLRAKERMLNVESRRLPGDSNYFMPTFKCFLNDLASDVARRSWYQDSHAAPTLLNRYTCIATESR